MPTFQTPYAPTGYFPLGGGAPAGAPPPPGLWPWPQYWFGAKTKITAPAPIDFLQAIGDCLSNDISLMAMIPAGVFYFRAPPRITYPVLVFSIVARARDQIAEGVASFQETGTLEIAVWGKSVGPLDAIADRAVEVLEGAADGGTLVFQEGIITNLYQGNLPPPPEPKLDPNRVIVWGDRRYIEYVFVNPTD